MLINGSQFLDRVDQLHHNIWLNGEVVNGPLSTHSVFKGILNSKSKLYDLQHDDEHKELFKGYSEPNGEEYSFSFHQPKSKEELVRRGKATTIWARDSLGMMGRSPDYINSAIMCLGSGAEFFSNGGKEFGTSINSVYNHAKRNDLSFTHTFINPQVNRSLLHYETDENIIAAKVIDETDKGIIIKGARLLATQGGITDEILVLPSGGNYIEGEYIYGFVIPSDTKGLKFLCREAFNYSDSSFDHPLASRYEETDSVVVFDHVLVPWNRVFLYKNHQVAMNFINETGMYHYLQYQAVCRQIVKTECILGLAEKIVDIIQIQQYQHIQDKVNEIIIGLEIMKSLKVASEVQGTVNNYGTYTPSIQPLSTAVQYYTKFYPRLMEIIQLLSSSGIISIPTEKDFQSEIRDDLNQYLQGANADAVERVKTFRLAWDLSMSAFGSRQTQFERFFFGDPVRLAMGSYNHYDKQPFVKDISQFLNLEKGKL